MAKKQNLEGIDISINNLLINKQNIANHKRTEELEAKAKSSLSSLIKNNLTRSENENILELFNRLALSTSNKASGKGGNKSKIEVFQELLNDGSAEKLNGYFLNDRHRLANLAIYDKIYKMIPELRKALKIIAHNIMNPNDFTSVDPFVVNINNKLLEDDQINNLRDRFKDLSKTYRIAPRSVDIVLKTLKYGLTYVVVHSLGRELEGQMSQLETKSSSLSKGFFRRTTSGSRLLGSESLNVLKSFKLDDDSKLTKKYEEDLSEFVERHFEFTDKDDVFSYEMEVAKEAKNLDLSEEISGSVVKVVNPDKLIKLGSGDHIIGYLHLESGDLDSLEERSKGLDCFSDVGSSALARVVNNVNSGNYGQEDTTKFSNVLADYLASKVDRKFIAKNAQFKNAIYHILKDQNLRNKRYKMAFIPAEDVVEFKIGETEYGESVFENITFFARLYISTLMATMMQKVINSTEKTVYYINTGLDNDIEGSINQFISDIKSTETIGENINDLDYVLNIITSARNQYVPVVDGARAVDQETFSAPDPQIDNEFLEFLKNSMMTGTGVPNNLIDSTNDVDFARTVTAQNGLLARDVAIYQEFYFNIKFQELFFRLYNNEFKVEYENDKKVTASSKEEEDILNTSAVFDITTITLHPPKIVDNENYDQQIQQASSLIENILRFEVGEDEPQDEKEATKFKEKRKNISRKLFRKFMPSIDWGDIDSILEEIQLDEQEKDVEDINAPKEAPAEGEEGEGDGFNF